MLRREAARWVARLQGPPDADRDRRFRQWHDADPRHSAAFARVRRSYEMAGLLRHSAVAEPRAIAPELRTQRRVPLPALAAAAVVLLVIAPVTVLLVRSAGLLVPTRATMLATGIGEIRTVTLNDGSRLVLDTSTRVDVEIGANVRRLQLREGRIRLAVNDGRPQFTVETPKMKIIIADGTADILSLHGKDRIDVLSGTSDVASKDGAAISRAALGPSESTSVGGNAEEPAPASGGGRWTMGMLQFDGTPLGEAVARANLYSSRKIRLDGGLQALPVTGAYRAGDTAGLAMALAAAFDLSLKRGSDGTIALSRR